MLLNYICVTIVYIVKLILTKYFNKKFKLIVMTNYKIPIALCWNYNNKHKY